MIQNAIKTLGDIAATAFGYFLVAIVGALFVVLTIIIFPFVFVWEWVRTVFWARETLNPIVMDEYHGLVDAFFEGDIAFLDAYAASDPEFPDTVDRFIGRTWLINAIDLGTPKTVQWVLDQGVELENYDDEGMSPLTSAITRDEPDEPEVVEMLLDRGADVNTRNTLDVTPLHVAAAHGSEDVVRLLLDRGADPMAWDSDYGPSRPIGFVDATKRPEIKKMLAEAMNAARS